MLGRGRCSVGTYRYVVWVRGTITAMSAARALTKARLWVGHRVAELSDVKYDAFTGAGSGDIAFASRSVVLIFSRKMWARSQSPSMTVD
jgi:hypothetical protein